MEYETVKMLNALETHFARLCAERELGRGIARRWFA